VTPGALWGIGAAVVGAIGVGVAVVLRSNDDEGTGGDDGGSGDDTAGVATVATPLEVLSSTHPQDIEALARMIQSEEGGSSQERQVAVAWICINEAAKEGRSVYALLTRPTGGYGHQGGGEGRNGYASTASTALPSTQSLAQGIWAGRFPDPTGGALHFDSPRSQDYGIAHNLPGYHDKDGNPWTPERVAAKRRGEGFALALLPGVDEYEFRMWRPA